MGAPRTRRAMSCSYASRLWSGMGSSLRTISAVRDLSRTLQSKISASSRGESL
jgi:hypothetical protein